MDCNLDIFVSSAIGEFANERKALKTALERWQFVHAWVFEEAAAYSEPRDAGFLRRAAECDIFVLLIGDDYRKPVEDEFATALNMHRSILAFVKRSSKMQADSMFEKYQASDKFKYAIFDDVKQLEEQVIEAVTEDIVRRVRLSSRQALQLVTAQPQPQFSPSEREQLDQEYIAEVTRKYEFWREHYAPLAAIAQLQSRATPAFSATPAEFLPRGFDVLLREKFSRESEVHDAKTEHYDDLRDAIGKHGDLILLGDPGAGKTTTLWRLMFDYAQRAQSNQTTTKPTHLPILISLGRYDGTVPILDFLRTELVLQSKADSTGTSYPAHRRLAAHLDEYLVDGRLMLLFDALNEMPQAHYSDSVRRLEQFRDAQRDNRFIFTCRALDYTTKLDMPEATIQELDEDAQKDFLAACFSDTGTRLFETLHDDHKDLLDIGRNPYVLLMIGQVYQLLGELPTNRGLLFQGFVNALMERERQTHPDHWLDAETKIRVLSDLAFAIQREHGRGTSVPREWADKFLTGSVRVNGRDVAYNATDFLYFVRGASLLDESADGSLRFTHQLLQEYFAAVGLLRLSVNDPQVRETARHYSWDEVMVLLAGLMDDATPLVELVMQVDPYLAARCMSGGQRVANQLSERLTVQLGEKLKSQFEAERLSAVRALSEFRTASALALLLRPLLKNDEWNIRDAAVRGLSRLRVTKETQERVIIPLLLAIIRDGKNRWEAAKAISRFEARIVLPYLLPMLKDEDRYAREDAALVLGKLKSEMAVPYLLPLLKDRVSDVRRASIEALGKIKAEVAVPHLIPLLKDRSVKTRAAVAEVLGVDLKKETAIPYLIDLLYDKNFDVLDIAEASLVEINPQAVLAHLPALLGRRRKIPSYGKFRSLFLELSLLMDYQDSHRKWMVVTSVLCALREDTEKVMPYLIPLATHKNYYKRQAAAWAMGYLKAAMVLPYLAAFCGDSSPNVRISSALAIRKLRSAKSIKYLIPLLRDKNSEVRTAAVWALGQMNNKASCSRVMPLLKDKNWLVRWKTIEALGALGAQFAIPALIRNLAGRDTIIKATVEALGKLGAKKAIPNLTPLLNHKNPQIRNATAQALFEIAGTESFPHLISLLKDENADVRGQVTKIVGRFETVSCVPHLLTQLKDRNSNVRRAAISAISKNGTDIAFLNLIPILKDREYMVRHDARDALKPKVSEKHLLLLVPLLSNDNADVRNAAFEIIESVKRRLSLPKDYVIESEIQNDWNGK
jgi:HEAT repeat protein